MPELPEVEVTRRSLLPHIINQCLEDIQIYQPKLRYAIDTAGLKRIALNQPITALKRRSKYLIFQLPKKRFLISHLGMTGHWKLCTSGEPLAKHDHLQFRLGNGFNLRYHDVRRFGLLEFYQGEIEQAPRLLKLGLEPLAIDGAMANKFMDAASLYERLQATSRPIKLAIMDASLLVGVGNIYANESLFLAAIHPRRAANRLSKKRVIKLELAIKDILQKAINQGGSSLNDFINPEQNPGYFQQTLKVYGRNGRACQRCQKSIKKIRLGQRSTFYCAGCQH